MTILQIVLGIVISKGSDILMENLSKLRVAAKFMLKLFLQLFDGCFEMQGINWNITTVFLTSLRPVSYTHLSRSRRPSG